MVLGTVVTRSNINGWTIAFTGLAFDGFRLHAMHWSGWHDVINRQNFLVVANQVFTVEILPAITYALGLAFDGKQFWTINRDPSPDELLCYKLQFAVNPRPIKTITLSADGYTGVTFDGKNLILARGNLIEFWNPQSEVMVDSFVPGFPSRDLTFDGEYLWLCDGINDWVYCIDPISRAIITRFAFPPAPDSWPSGITFDGKYLWIGTYPNGAGTIYCVEKS